MARIYRKNNSWYFTIEAGMQANGKRRRIIRGGFSREKDAKKAAREFENNLEAGTLVIKTNNITLHEFMWCNWFNYHKNFVKISTQVVLKGSLKRIDRYFGEHARLKNITPTMCLEFINTLFYEYKLSRATIITTLSSLKMIFKHAVVVEKILANDPTKYISLPKLYAKDREKLTLQAEQKKLYLEKNEVLDFLKATQLARNAFPFTMFFTLLIYTGMRTGEALALEWKNIDFANKVIRVRATVYYRVNDKFDVYSPKTKRSIRDIIMPDTLVMALKSYRKQFLEYKLRNRSIWKDNGYDFVFVSQKEPGNPIRYSTVSSCARRLGRKIGIKNLHPHMFRHTHVSILAAQRVPLAAIKERLGHSTDKTTEQIYLHITKQFKIEVANAFDDALQNS